MEPTRCLLTLATVLAVSIASSAATSETQPHSSQPPAAAELRGLESGAQHARLSTIASLADATQGRGSWLKTAIVVGGQKGPKRVLVELYEPGDGFPVRRSRSTALVRREDLQRTTRATCSMRPSSPRSARPLS